MLETLDLTSCIEKEVYSPKIKDLKARLSVLQQEVKELGIPIVVLFEGWGAAGKGCMMSEIIQTLDPRNYNTYSTLPPSSEEKRHAFLWRHWLRTPVKGKFAIFDRSWYPEVSIDRAKKNCSSAQTRQMLNSINRFERQLADDGTLVLKFFLHISKKEQRKRLDSLAACKSTRWRVSETDYDRNENYDKLYKVFDSVLEHSNTSYAPWNLISGHDRRGAILEVYTILVQAVEQAVAAKKAQAAPVVSFEASSPLTPGEFTVLQMPELKEIKLNQAVAKDDYKKQLEEAQTQLRELHNEVYRKKIPVVIVYEGWDAAGKGGNIKRLTSALDPRGYTVVPIASPSTLEKSHHYLWRFWNQMGKDGHITIFDRSWYGRVMVERVEGFAAQQEWSRAYQEINEFEQELAQWGALVHKFWLQLDKDEQLRRFESRQNTPEKQWKITEEDWRNRDKWDLYETAVNDMLRLTSTDFAPWHIIESQDKYFARLKVLNIMIDAIKERLKK